MRVWITFEGPPSLLGSGSSRSSANARYSHMNLRPTEAVMTSVAPVLLKILARRVEMHLLTVPPSWIQAQRITFLANFDEDQTMALLQSGSQKHIKRRTGMLWVLVFSTSPAARARATKKWRRVESSRRQVYENHVCYQQYRALISTPPLCYASGVHLPY